MLTPKTQGTAPPPNAQTTIRTQPFALFSRLATPASATLITSLTAACFFGTLLSGCGSQSHDPQTSQTKIVNGIVIAHEDLAEVVNLTLVTTQGYEGSCTGTFVNDHQVLTAGHCVVGIKAVATQVNGLTVAARSYALHPQYRQTQNSAHDVALLNFPAGTATSYRSIAAFAPTPGQEIAIIGYGNTEVQPYIDIRYHPIYGTYSQGMQTSGADGRKRLGFNTLDRRENGTLVFVGKMSASGKPGDDAAAAQGDSGGPMLAQGADGRWQIVGVTSAGQANLDEQNVRQYESNSGEILVRQGLASVDTVYVDLASSSVRAFLAQNQDPMTPQAH